MNGKTNAENSDPNKRHSKLFTPGPLTTSNRVRQALPYDIGSREEPFQKAIREVRERLKRFAFQSGGDMEVVLQPGSGTMAVEGVIGSSVPKGGKILVIANGAYGKRLAQICETLNIQLELLQYPETEPPKPEEIHDKLTNDDTITHVGLVHCETSSGMLLPLEEIVNAIESASGPRGRRTLIVDGMSSFGGLSLSLKGVDCLVTSSNKCLQGVPGLSIIFATSPFLRNATVQRSFSLQLYHQWVSLSDISQFRFTPPTQVLLGLLEALKELEEETLEGRYERYRNNHEIVVKGMRQMGFKEFLKPSLQAPIITSFLWPDSPHFNFTAFYEKLAHRGFVIYPGKVSNVSETFRLGNIGHLFSSDMEDLLEAIRQVKSEMGF